MSQTDGAAMSNDVGSRLHILANDPSFPSIRKLCQNYIKYEDAIDTIVPSSRRTSCATSRRLFRSNKRALTTIATTNKEWNEVMSSCQNMDYLVATLHPDGRKSYKLSLQNIRGGNNTNDDDNNDVIVNWSIEF